MVRRRRELGSVLLLLAGLCLPALESVAQSTPKSTATPHPKAHAHRKEGAHDPPAPQALAIPPTLAQTPPTPPRVTYNNGQLTIIAQNATLSQVLLLVQSQTGASIEMPAGVSSERVVGQFGPGPPLDVLNSLLNGSKFNYIILGVTGNRGAVQKVILTTSEPASRVNTAQNNAVQPPEEPQEEENDGEPESQPRPQTPLPSQIRNRPNVPGRMPQAVDPQPPQPQPTPDSKTDNTQPNGAKTPEQLLQELQQTQEQQQQMQEQLNPANRQPPQ
jgi:hypothetical protein